MLQKWDVLARSCGWFDESDSHHPRPLNRGLDRLSRLIPVGSVHPGLE
jgi:hypothetical protein